MFSVRLTAAIAALLLGLPALGQAPDLSKLDLVERLVPDGPVASVDGRLISRESFVYLYRTEVTTLSALQKDTVKDADRITTAISCVTELIQREVLLSDAAKRKITVPDAEVEDAYKKELGALQDALAKEGNKKTEEEVLHQGGRTRAEALDEMRKALTLEKVRDVIVKEKGITVSDAEVKEFYDKNQSRFAKGGGAHLKQIFVRPKPDAKTASEASWQEARGRIEEALGRIQAGESFEAVAKAVSEAPNREQGGDLGVAPVEQLPPFYRDALPGLKPGDLSPIIKSEYGLHVIQLLSLENEKTASFDQVKERVRKVLLQGKSESVIDAYCRPVYNDVNRVQVFLSLDRAIASIPESERPKTEASNAGKPAVSKPATQPAAKPPAETKKKGAKK